MVLASWALFSSPLAWVVLAFLQVTMAWILVTRLDAYLTVQTQLMQMDTPPGITEIIVAPIFGAAAVILIMAVPLLSMRLIAEERRNQTMTFLISAPLSMTQIVIGKFVGLYSFLMLSVALILVMASSRYMGGRLDLGLQEAQLVGLLDPDPERAEPAALLEGADAAQGKLEGPGADIGQCLVDLVGPPVLDLADEAQRQVVVLRRQPAGAGDAAGQHGELGLDGGGEGECDEEADHRRNSPDRAAAA